jgi:hypothetical protein
MNSKTKLSRSILDMKFMKKTKEKVEKEDAEAEGRYVKFKKNPEASKLLTCCPLVHLEKCTKMKSPKKCSTATPTY